jgi:hypothetical protein
MVYRASVLGFALYQGTTSVVPLRRKENWASAPAMAILHQCIAHLSMVQDPVKAGLIRLLGGEKSAGAKAHVFVDHLERHD